MRNLFVPALIVATLGTSSFAYAETAGGVIVMRFGENAQRTIARVTSKLADLEQGLPPGVAIDVAYDRSDLMIRGMRDVGIPATRASFATRCDNNGVYHELLRAGCGIGVAQARVAGADPQLVRLFPEFPLPTLPLYLAAHEAMRQTPRVRRVWDHLARHLSEWVIPGSAGRPAA